jgi:hypothetical protein
MKKVLILPVLIAFLLSGCSWMDGEYHSVKPHDSANSQQQNNAVMVSDYNELRDALVDLVTSGRTERTFYTSGIDEEMVEQYMNTAIMHMFQNSAVGAYAVEKVNYEYGTSGGTPAIAVYVEYLHGRQEILRIKNAVTMNGVRNLLTDALKNCDASIVLKVSQYEEFDVEQFVRNFVNENPHLCMEMPVVTAGTYPQRGEERVLEVLLTYQSSRDALRTMQDMVSPIFSAAELYVQDSEDTHQKYEQLYAFLMERFDYKIETSNTPAYSLLRYGVGDSKAFATVYSAMCRNAGLECQVVSGTRSGEAWYWNYILIDDTYYHVDLLADNESDAFYAMRSEDMIGYVWDYSVYP